MKKNHLLEHSDFLDRWFSDLVQVIVFPKINALEFFLASILSLV